ncbi:DegV domain-containing protein YitS [Geodia barretti]|uniref:DegV domain-containing protein YitS n=1 Tax=Geodia barretti TaxID=519541 RepID=A0AA35TLB0_GEOBA|nr:DegV domain-containing protein YitS [Geodia barretti]
MSDHREVARRVERSIERNHGFVLVDTLKYLAMGGRIGKAQALLGGVLQFKPIVGIRDGETHPVDRPRTRRRAQRRIIELVRELAPIHQLHVSYSTGPDNALAVRDELADLVEPERLIESPFGPVLGTHLGPNTIGVAATQGSVEDD